MNYNTWSRKLHFPKHSKECRELIEYDANDIKIIEFQIALRNKMLEEWKLSTAMILNRLINETREEFNYFD